MLPVGIRVHTDLVHCKARVKDTKEKAGLRDEQGTKIPPPEPKCLREHLRLNHVVITVYEDIRCNVCVGATNLQHLRHAPLNGGVARVQATKVVELLVVAKPNRRNLPRAA